VFKREKEKENLKPNEYSLYFSSPTFFFHSEQKTFDMSNTYKRDDKKAKKKGKYTHTHNTITEMMYCTEGRKRSYVYAYKEQKKKEEKKVAEKERI
jgi:hypothetical protein